MNEKEADKALRDLFQQDGVLRAPEGLDARILQRIALTPRTVIAPEKPLLPKWTWLIAIAGLCALVLLGGPSGGPGWSDRLPAYDWEPYLRSPWTMMALATITALLGLQTWLDRRREIEPSR